MHTLAAQFPDHPTRRQQRDADTLVCSASAFLTCCFSNSNKSSFKVALSVLHAFPICRLASQCALTSTRHLLPGTSRRNSTHQCSNCGTRSLNCFSLSTTISIVVQHAWSIAVQLSIQLDTACQSFERSLALPAITLPALIIHEVAV